MRSNSRGLLLALCLFCLLAPTLRAEEGGGESNEEKFNRLKKEIYQSFKDQKFDDAAAKCKEQSALFPKQSGPYYNLACAQSRLKKTDDALASLAKSIELGYNDAEHMKTDDDLANIRGEKKFDDLAAKAGENAKKNPPGLEPSSDIPGVKTISDLPEGGLRYRLRLSNDATVEKPSKLVIWLHPSGGSMNDIVEKQLAADFAKHGFALLVMTQKQWNGWSGEEAEKLLNKDLPALAKVPGLDVKKPLLMGFSAGGQLALQLWSSNPDAFGGFILDAAYPIDMQLYMQGKVGMLKLPENEAIKKTPFFVLVGAADPSKAAWEQSEATWRKGGVPLTLEYVPNGKHQWLVGGKQKKEILDWLDEVKAGKLPGLGGADAKTAAAGAAKPNVADRMAIPEAQPKAEAKPAKRNDTDGLTDD